MNNAARFLLLAMLVEMGHSRVCYVGSRDLADSSPTSSLFYGQVCNSTMNEQCFLATYPTTSSVVKQIANCFDPTYNITCTYVATLYGIVDPTGCTTKYCNTDGCNRFTPAENCQATAESELLLTASCTLTDIIDKFEVCWRSLLAGFPYSDVTLCKRNIDNGLQCLAQAISTCASGDCITDLDILPLGLMYIMPMIPQYAMTFGNTATIFSLMEVPASSQNDVIGTVCLHSSSPYTAQISLLFQSLELNLTFENPFCDSKVLPEILEWHLQALPRLINANSHAVWCSFADDSKALMLNYWENRCNRSAAELLPKFMLPAGYEFLSGKMASVVTTMENFVRNYQMPGCGGSSDNTVYNDSGNSSDGIHAKHLEWLQRMLVGILTALTL